MAYTEIRSILLFSLATAVVGCANEIPAFDKPTDTQIAGRDVKIIPYTQTGNFGGTKTEYVLCILPGITDCYSPSGYKAKVGNEVDQVLKK